MLAAKPSNSEANENLIVTCVLSEEIFSISGSLTG
jgi:hypothetical protein